MKGADPRIIEAPPGRGLTGPRLLRAVLTAVVVLPLASRPLATWAADLPDAASGLRDVIQRWDESMGRAGLTRPYEVLHDRVRALVAAAW